MNRKILSLILLILSVVLFCQTSGKAGAITSSPDGLSLSPALQQVSLSPKDAKVTVKFIITNNTDASKILNLSVNDFNTLNESGGLFFVGTNPTQIQQRYGLANWASLPNKQITIAPKQNATIYIDILNQKTLMPGGHYGALMVAINNNSQNSGNNVDVKPVASALMFVTKLGGDTHNLELKSVTAHHGLFSLPSQVDIKFHNIGNTHVTPRGVVSVFSPGGKLISKGIINEDSSLILPESNRTFTISLKNIGTALWPGRYKLKAEVRFDGLDQTRTYQSSFFVFPVFSLFMVVLLGATIVLVYVTFWKNRRKVKKQKANPSQ